MKRGWILGLCGLLAACEGRHGRMAHAEDPGGRYREQIAAARRVLEQNEDWADRAEWEVTPAGDGWEVNAWRVEHPDKKGAERYSPVGYSTIDLDSRLAATHYRPKK
ncbi:MAG TPA: hypothetical protein VHB20_03100 [Verrucomicrobiae bacterium]|jgi:hypothetical protein|nr:hypothetical protein [Verrucomicrobiae bacterium]